MPTVRRSGPPRGRPAREGGPDPALTDLLFVRLKLKCDRNVPCQSCKVSLRRLCPLRPSHDAAILYALSGVGTNRYVPTVRSTYALSSLTLPNVLLQLLGTMATGDGTRCALLSSSLSSLCIDVHQNGHGGDRTPSPHSDDHAGPHPATGRRGWDFTLSQVSRHSPSPGYPPSRRRLRPSRRSTQPPICSDRSRSLGILGNIIGRGKRIFALPWSRGSF